MKLPERRTRLVAATPIDVGEVRLLPSVLVETTAYRAPGRGLLRQLRARPVSIVVEGPESSEWLETPNETAATLSRMAVPAVGIALSALFLVGVIRFLRHR